MIRSSPSPSLRPPPVTDDSDDKGDEEPIQSSIIKAVFVEGKRRTEHCVGTDEGGV